MQQPDGMKMVEAVQQRRGRHCEDSAAIAVRQLGQQRPGPFGSLPKHLARRLIRVVGGVVEQRRQPGPFDAPASGDARFEMRCVGVFGGSRRPCLRPLAALRQIESGVGEQSVGGVQAQFPAGVEAECPDRRTYRAPAGRPRCLRRGSVRPTRCRRRRRSASSHGRRSSATFQTVPASRCGFSASVSAGKAFSRRASGAPCNRSRR